MAKAKKEKLSLEELLEQALVKEGERPYEVPGNWVWTRLDYISQIVTGGTPSKSNEDYYGGSFPFVKPADLDQGRHVLNATEYLSDEGKVVSRVIPFGSTSVCCIGTIGKSGYLEFDATTNQQINSIIPSKVKNLFVYYYCCTDYFVNYLNSLASATTISIVNKGKMSTVPIPLPPLAEQQRIVDIIESLFEKLDAAKELVQNALDSFENRKAAILHKAFTGELTAKWREENGVNFNEWEDTLLSKVVTGFKYGISEKSDALYTGMPVIRIPNVISNEIDFADMKYLNHFDVTEENLIKENDILIIRSNGSRELVGKCALVGKLNEQYTFASYLIRIRPCNIDPDYLLYLLNSSYVRKQFFDKSKSSAGINNINSKELGSLKILLPSLKEQEEIVRILDYLLENEQKAKELCDVIEKIDLMKKAILARAFRGELGTNNPEEESAVELLKEVLKEKI